MNWEKLWQARSAGALGQACCGVEEQALGRVPKGLAPQQDSSVLSSLLRGSGHSEEHPEISL